MQCADVKDLFDYRCNFTILNFRYQRPFQPGKANLMPTRATMVSSPIGSRLAHFGDAKVDPMNLHLEKQID
jgi:hypothetical protein